MAFFNKLLTYFGKKRLARAWRVVRMNHFIKSSAKMLGLRETFNTLENL